MLIRKLHLNRTKSKRALNSRGIAVIGLTLILTSGFLSTSSREWLRSHQWKSPEEQPPLYLPSVKYVRLITLGFNNFASDLLWFNTVNYFGKQLTGPRDYRWLDTMCGLVTELDPRKDQVIEFCANMLSWEAHEFQRSIDTLTRAVKLHPDQWRWRYLRGFNYFYFMDRKDLALEDLQHASKLEGCPPFVAALASRLMVNRNDTDSAILFLKELIHNENDPNAKSALDDKLRRAYLSRDLRLLGQAVQAYEHLNGRRPTKLEDLVASGIAKSIPTEPFGGMYKYDPETNTVSTSTGEKALEFFGRNKDTGIFSMENKK